MGNYVDKKDVYKEVFVVLSNFSKEIIQKIPDELFRQLADFAADSEIEVKIDMNKGIEEQLISQESKDMLSLIYYKYIADDNEKKELIKVWESNEHKKY